MEREAEIEKKGEQLMHEENYLQAIDLFESEISIVKQSWRMLWNLGWSYFQLERYPEAEQFLRDATELSPDNAICKWALGCTLTNNGKFDEAEGVLREALQIKESFLCRRSLARALMHQGKFDEAEDMHLKAIELSPDDSERLKTYAAFLSDVGREAEAQEMYRRAKKA